MEHRKNSKLSLNNQGSITFEAVFVMPIIIGVIFSLIFISLYCFDHIYIECQLRSQVRDKKSEKVIEGILGQGSIMDNSKLDFFRSSYKLDYEIISKYPFTSYFLGAGCHKLNVELTICERDSCEFVRKYDALVKVR